MTDRQIQAYARMSERQRAAIDALSPGLRPAAIDIWIATEHQEIKRVNWRTVPRRETLDTGKESAN